MQISQITTTKKAFSFVIVPTFLSSTNAKLQSSFCCQLVLCSIVIFYKWGHCRTDSTSLHSVVVVSDDGVHASSFPLHCIFSKHEHPRALSPGRLALLSHISYSINTLNMSAVKYLLLLRHWIVQRRLWKRSWSVQIPGYLWTVVVIWTPCGTCGKCLLNPEYFCNLSCSFVPHSITIYLLIICHSVSLQIFSNVI